MSRCHSEVAHTPVLLEEVISLFRENRITSFYEGTVGAGGHASALLEAHPEIEKYHACDRDAHALELSQDRLKKWRGRISFIQGNFAELPAHLGDEKVDGFLFDLGVSSMQLDQPARGFSFQREGPLDMRMDPRERTTAREVVNRMSEEELGRIFRELGEERFWRRIARAIALRRRERPIETTLELATIVSEVTPRRGRLHPATHVFQALRLHVNRELDTLKGALTAALSRLKPGGRAAVISFHSLEDRIVKQLFREETVQRRRVEPPFLLRLLTKKPIMARLAEQQMNPRARSARLRAVERVMV